MRAMVTGGAGFLGSHLIERLLARGDRVICLERPGAPRGWLAGREVDFRDCGLEDEDAIRAAAADADVVFHLAALTSPCEIGAYYRVNTEGTARVMRAAAACGPKPPRVVFVSSLAAVGPSAPGAGLARDCVPYPRSHYGMSKLLAENVVLGYADRVPVVVLRLPALYGPRDRAVLALFRMVSNGLVVNVGSWEREVSLLHVSDAADGLLAAALSPRAPGRIYFLSHPEAVTWRQFVDAAGRAIGRRPRKISIPSGVAAAASRCTEFWSRRSGRPTPLTRDRLRDLRQPRWVCDPAAAVDEIGFRPRFPAERGIRQTVSWLRRERWI